MRLNWPACLELANETTSDNDKSNNINSNINCNILIVMSAFKGD